MSRSDLCTVFLAMGNCGTVFAIVDVVSTKIAAVLPTVMAADM